MIKSDNQLAKIKPTAGYVLIQAEEQQTKTTGGIYLPDNAKGDKPQTGTVLAAGPDEVTDSGTKKPSSAKAGTRSSTKSGAATKSKLKARNTFLLNLKISSPCSNGRQTTKICR